MKKLKIAISKIRHICSNVNYKRRYNNLLKKYETLDEEYQRLTNKLSQDYINMQLQEAQKQANKYKQQRDNARKDYIELQKRLQEAK